MLKAKCFKPYALDLKLPLLATSYSLFTTLPCAWSLTCAYLLPAILKNHSLFANKLIKPETSNTGTQVGGPA